MLYEISLISALIAGLAEGIILACAIRLYVMRIFSQNENFLFTQAVFLFFVWGLLSPPEINDMVCIQALIFLIAFTAILLSCLFHNWDEEQNKRNAGNQLFYRNKSKEDRFGGDRDIYLN